MTRDEILKLAREAGGLQEGMYFEIDVYSLERFAYLVAAAERQRICKQIAQLHDALSMASNPLITPRGSLGEEV